MKNILLFVCTILCSWTGFAQSGDQEILKKINEDWIHAYPSKDTATMSRIFADDIIMITPNGSKMSKKDMLAATASPGQKIQSTHVDSVEVRLLEKNVGLVMAYTSFVFVVDGKEMPGRNCYLDVYEKRKGRWVAVAAHVTVLSTK